MQCGFPEMMVHISTVFQESILKWIYNSVTVLLLGFFLCGWGVKACLPYNL